MRVRILLILIILVGMIAGFNNAYAQKTRKPIKLKDAIKPIYELDFWDLYGNSEVQEVVVFEWDAAKGDMPVLLIAESADGLVNNFVIGTVAPSDQIGAIETVEDDFAPVIYKKIFTDSEPKQVEFWPDKLIWAVDAHGREIEKIREQFIFPFAHSGDYVITKDYQLKHTGMTLPREGIFVGENYIETHILRRGSEQFELFFQNGINPQFEILSSILGQMAEQDFVGANERYKKMVKEYIGDRTRWEGFLENLKRGVPFNLFGGFNVLNNAPGGIFVSGPLSTIFRATMLAIFPRGSNPNWPIYLSAPATRLMVARLQQQFASLKVTTTRELEMVHKLAESLSQKEKFAETESYRQYEELRKLYEELRSLIEVCCKKMESFEPSKVSREEFSKLREDFERSKKCIEDRLKEIEYRLRVLEKKVRNLESRITMLEKILADKIKEQAAKEKQTAPKKAPAKKRRKVQPRPAPCQSTREKQTIPLEQRQEKPSPERPEPQQEPKLEYPSSGRFDFEETDSEINPERILYDAPAFSVLLLNGQLYFKSNREHGVQEVVSIVKWLLEYDLFRQKLGLGDLEFDPNYLNMQQVLLTKDHFWQLPIKKTDDNQYAYLLPAEINTTNTDYAKRGR